MSQCARILAVLSDGRPHTMTSIHAAVGFCRLNSRISELRQRGHDISCRRVDGDYVYLLLSSLEEPGATGGGGVPRRPTVPESPHPMGTTEPGSSSETEQLTLLTSPRNGAYSEAA